VSPPPAALGVIPARGGSKRIPRKNIRLLSGRPLITWAIEAALQSGQFEQVIVSTDDEQIAEIALQSGAAVPFMRPAELASDAASTVSVMAHAVTQMQAAGFVGALACCIYPASVFVSPSDFSQARAMLERSDRAYAATIVAYPHPIQRAFDLGPAGQIQLLDPAGATQRTQDLPQRWHDAGQFYWGRVDAWCAELPILPNAVGYELTQNQVQDIDTEDDWHRAQVIHSMRTAT